MIKNYLQKSVELDYYIKENISPVHYKISNIKKHFQIRNSLYRLLGFTPSFFYNKDVIEIAPGSGHNSIYTASLLPNLYHLVEPNPSGCKDIKKLFSNLKIKHTKPTLYPKSLDIFKNKKLYDVVITEGWPGGFLKYDKSMLKKMSTFVKPGGVFLISFLPPIGAMSTYIRRLIAYRLLNNNKNIKENTIILKKAFSSHLKNLKSMGRSYDHWIQDSILNPYLCIAHNTPQICSKILDKKFQIYNSIPKFANDWRWYKSLYGKNRQFNKFFLDDYNSFSHCMIDYRIEGFKRSKEQNIKLEKLCNNLALLTNTFEKKGHQIYINKVQPTIEKIIMNIKKDINENTLNALNEANILLKNKKIEINDVSKMRYFSKLFGREQCYLSFINESY